MTARLEMTLKKMSSIPLVDSLGSPKTLNKEVISHIDNI